MKNVWKETVRLAHSSSLEIYIHTYMYMDESDVFTFVYRRNTTTHDNKETEKKQAGSCCGGGTKKSTVETHPESASMFEFFKDSGTTKKKKNTSSSPNRMHMAMVGHCESVEGGLNACVWVPNVDDGDDDDARHTIIF